MAKMERIYILSVGGFAAASLIGVGVDWRVVSAASLIAGVCALAWVALDKRRAGQPRQL
jgi:hypothetical protein